LPHEAGLSLREAPVAPRHRLWLLAVSGAGREDWAPYLGVEPLTA